MWFSRRLSSRDAAGGCFPLVHRWLGDADHFSVEQLHSLPDEWVLCCLLEPLLATGRNRLLQSGGQFSATVAFQELEIEPNRGAGDLT
jgi:hypothetical protein